MPTLRPIALACSLLAGLAVVPISAGQDAPGAALLRGRVTSKAGVPLVDARVRVAVPAADLRADDLGTNHRVFEARTDAEGRYLVDLGGITAPTSASIDAMAPGFRRLVGTFRAGGDAREVQIKPGATIEADLALEPARHYAGVVVDEEGRPIAGAQILSSIQSARSTGFIERTSSGPDGAFDLYCYPFKLTQRLDEPCRGVVTFSHPDYQEAKVDDVDRVEPGRRGNLRIVMPAGRKVGSVREFVDRILAEVGDRVAPVHKVRVVYGYKTTEFVGTNTQYLELTPADVEGLRAASARLAAGKP